MPGLRLTLLDRLLGRSLSLVSDADLVFRCDRANADAIASN